MVTSKIPMPPGVSGIAAMVVATQLRSEHRGQWDQIPTAEAGSQEVAGMERYEVAISPDRS